MKNIAFIVPHGDDESLGFGGVIQKHVSNGDNVTVVFCTAPTTNRLQKQFNDIEAAKQVLGYQKVEYLYVTKREVMNEPYVLFKTIEDKMKELSPDIVYTTFWGDVHQDHKAVYESVMRSVRVWGSLKVKQFFVGEIPSSTDQYPAITGPAFTPNYYVPLTKEQVKTKVDSLLAYKNETNQYPHPRSEKGILTKAAIRGQECGVEYAEAFMCIRHICD